MLMCFCDGGQHFQFCYPSNKKSLTSVLKAAKFSSHLLLRESADKFVASCNPALKSGFWNVAEAVVTAESRLEFQKLLGYHQTNRAGFGSFHQPEIPHKDSHAYRKLTSSVLKEDEDLFRAKAVKLHLQGIGRGGVILLKTIFLGSLF